MSKKANRVARRYPMVPIQTPFPQTGYTDCTPKYLHCEFRPNRFS